ncbi:MAG: hypothetical protein ACOX6T_24090 [Myxococcales bacterium]|jgi:hypothetical protein
MTCLLNHRRCSALAVLLVLLSCKPSKPNTEQLVGKLRQTLTAATSYRASVEATTKPNSLARPDPGAKVTSSAEFAAVLPDRLLMKTRSSSPGPFGRPMQLDGSLTLDGATAWVAMRMAGAPGGPLDNVLKLDQKKLAPADKPYRIGFSVNGIGLRGGEDLLGSLLAYLADYELEPQVSETVFAGEPAWRVDGSLKLEHLLRQLPRTDPAFFGSYASMLKPGASDEKQRQAALDSMTRAAVQSIEGTLKVSLYFSRKDQRLVGWEQGSAKEMVTAVVLKSFEPGAAVPPETFAPAKDLAEGARDGTPELLALRAKADEVLADHALVEQAITSLKAAVEAAVAAAPAGR